MVFENFICLSYLGCSSSFTFEFITHELYMPQSRAHRYIHLITLQGQVIMSGCNTHVYIYTRVHCLANSYAQSTNIYNMKYSNSRR
jgi:DNA-binding IclR family transcriptional regulator